jgi:hypothetical protein
MVERIDALIAKTNAYEHFVVHFHANVGDGKELAMRIVYRSPTELVIDIQGETFRSFNRVRANAIDCLRIQDGAPTGKASLRDWNPSAHFVQQLRGLIEKEFSGALQADDLPERASPIIELTMPADDSSLSFSFGVGTSSEPRFGWLTKARRRPERVSLGAAGSDEFVLAYTEKSSVFLSLQTGFVTRIEKRTDSGVRPWLELTALETAEPPADSEFELPDPGERVQDITDGLAETMEGQGLGTSRNDLFRTIARGIDAGRIEWTDEAPAKIERVMRAMHAVDFAPVCARQLRERKALIEKLAEAFGEHLKSLDMHDPATVADETELVQGGRQKLADSLAQFLDGVLTQGMPRGTCKLRPSLYEDLGTLDKRTLSDAFAETVTKPLFAAFDGQVAKQLEAR